MSFTFSDPADRIDNQFDYEYDPDTETIILVEEKQMAGMVGTFDAECGACGETIDMQNPPTKCPGCHRDIVDYEEK